VIDNFTLALIHGLLAIAVWRLLMRRDLDEEARGVRKDPADTDSRG